MWLQSLSHRRVRGAVHTHGCAPVTGSAAATPATGGQKAKAAAGLPSVPSPRGVKPSLQGSLVGTTMLTLLGWAKAHGKGRGKCQLCHQAHPWRAGPAWPSHSAPLGEELCAEIAVGKPPPPFPELKICQGCVCREIFISQEPWQAGLAKEKSHVPWAWGHPQQPCSWSRVQMLVGDTGECADRGASRSGLHHGKRWGETREEPGDTPQHLEDEARDDELELGPTEQPQGTDQEEGVRTFVKVLDGGIRVMGTNQSGIFRDPEDAAALG